MVQFVFLPWKMKEKSFKIVNIENPKLMTSIIEAQHTHKQVTRCKSFKLNFILCEIFLEILDHCWKLLRDESESSLQKALNLTLNLSWKTGFQKLQLWFKLLQSFSETLITKVCLKVSESFTELLSQRFCWKMKFVESLSFKTIWNVSKLLKFKSFFQIHHKNGWI